MLKVRTPSLPRQTPTILFMSVAILVRMDVCLAHSLLKSIVTKEVLVQVDIE